MWGSVPSGSWGVNSNDDARWVAQATPNVQAIQKNKALHLSDEVISTRGSAANWVHSDSTTWDGNPANQEVEFSFSLRATKAESPNGNASLIAGFRSEGGQGKSLLLGFFNHPSAGGVVGLADTMGGLRFPLLKLNFADGEQRDFRFIKYIDIASGEMLVQVLLNNQSILSEPIRYSDLPSDGGRTDGFLFGTFSPSSFVGEISSAFFGPKLSKEVPLVGDREKVLTIIPEAEITLNWKSPDASPKLLDGVPVRAYWESNRVAVTSNSFYDAILPRYKVPAGTSLIVEACLFRTNQRTPEMPTFYFHENRDAEGNNPMLGTRILVPPDVTGMRLRIFADSSDIPLPSHIALRGPESWPLEIRPPIPERRQPISDETAGGGQPGGSGALNVKPAVDGTRLHLGGEVVPPILYSSFGSLSPDMGAHSFAADAGIHIHHRVAPATSNFLNDAIWVGPGEYRFDRLDAQIQRILEADPMAKIILSLNADPYRSWGESHPQDVCMNGEGKLAIGYEHFGRWGDNPNNVERFLPSLYSAKVESDIAAFYQAAVKHIESGPYANAVVGYGVVGFNDLQFVNWGHWESFKGGMDDYSPASLAGFRDFLKNKYGNDEQQLRLSWKSDSVTFESAQIPTPDQRRKGGRLFLDPESDQQVIDFNRFYVEGPINLVSKLATSIKEALGKNEKPVLTFYASAMNGASASAGLGHILAQEDINFLAAPADYLIRLPGSPSGIQSIPDSVRLAGKIFFHEQDWRSYHNSPRFDFDTVDGRAPTPAALESMIKRDTGNILVRRQATWFFDLSPGTFSGPEAVASMEKAVSAARNTVTSPQPEMAEVAFLIGENSLDHLSMQRGATYRWYLMRLARRHWDTSGVPYHIYLQSDLLKRDFSRYKLLIFVSPQFIAAEELEIIQELKRNNRTFVFLGAPGLLLPGDPLKNIENISGITLSSIEPDARYSGTWIPGDSILTDGLHGSFSDGPIIGHFPAREISGPMAIIADSSASPLAQQIGAETVVCAWKQNDGWKSVLMGVPQLTNRFLHNLAIFSGAWVAAKPGDVLHADGHFLVIHATSSGRKNLTFPVSMDILEPESGKLISSAAQQIELPMELGETRWFILRKSESKKIQDQ